MKVSKLLLVVVTLVVGAQSYAGKVTNNQKQGFSADPNIWKNKTGPTYNNSEECPLKSFAAMHAKTTQEIKTFRRAAREEVR